MTTEVKHILNEFPGITLEEMNGVALMKRTDTKFILPRSSLANVLRRLKNKYSVLEIKGNRLMTYESLYFDTRTRKFYMDHHNGKNNRVKVRIRNYVESDLFFLEVKRKDGKGRTNKSRTQINHFENKLSADSREFVKMITGEDFDLNPSLWNRFKRITLVSKESQERVTIDLDLFFKKDDLQKSYDDLVIIEVKQERFDRNSAMIQQLKSIHQNPYSISKYCIGMVNLTPDIKYNRFKKKLIQIDKLVAA